MVAPGTRNTPRCLASRGDSSRARSNSFGATPASARQACVFCAAGDRGGWGGDGGWSQGGNGGIAFSIGGGTATANGGNAGSASGGRGGRGGSGFLPVCNQNTNDWWGDDGWNNRWDDGWDNGWDW